MESGFFQSWRGRFAAVAVLGLAAGLATGCRNQATPPRTDQQIASDIQARINGEGALAGQNIQVAVSNGVATLNGTVPNDASRALAGNDSGSIAGVKTVVNNLTVQPPAEAAAAPPPQPARSEPSEQKSLRSRDRERERDSDHQQYQPPPPQPRPEYQPQQQAQNMAPPPPPPQPAAPPKPAVREVTLPAGTVIPVRISEELSSKDAQQNDAFHGALAADLGTQGMIAIHRGAPITGRVLDAKDAAHFKGNSLLSLELTQVTANGRKVSLVTDAYSKQGAGRGKNTAEKAGGGAILGAIIGGLAGGGKGAAIGTLAGGAAGTGVNAVTRGEQVVIPSETVINFQLKSPITVTVSPSGQNSDSGQVPEPQLQQR